MPKHHLKIGQAAERVQMNPKTIRYYEEIGLLPKASRNASGYRLYSQEDLDRLQFIRRAKLLGLTLTETKHVVEYAVLEQCGELQLHLLDLLERKLLEIDEKVADLIAFKNDVSNVRANLQQRLGQNASLGPSASPHCQCLTEEGGGRSESTLTQQ